MVAETDFIQDLLNSKHVYAYYVPALDVIKVGFGDDAKNRMLNYCKNYGIIPDISSLRSWEMPASALASAMETALHRGLHKAGFSRYILKTKNGVAQELFALNGTPYGDAFLYITDIFDIVCKELVSKLQYNHTDTEKVRQRQKVITDKQSERNREIYLKDQAIKKEKQLLLDKEWDIGWTKHIKPWGDILKTADEIRSSYKPPLAVRLFGKDEFSYFVKWDGFKLLLELLPKTFIAERQARAFSAQFVKNHGFIDPTNWSNYSPRIHNRYFNVYAQSGGKWIGRYDRRLTQYINISDDGKKIIRFVPTKIEDEIKNVLENVFGYSDQVFAMNTKEIIQVKELAQSAPMPEIDIFKNWVGIGDALCIFAFT